MKLQNPITFLLDNYYDLKYIKKNKKFKYKNINFYIASIYKKTSRNKKFKLIQYIYNPFTTFYLKRNIFGITKAEAITIMDEIDNNNIINNPRFDMEEYYQKYPMTQYEFYSLKNYNFYDCLFFEYADHKDRAIVLEELMIFQSKKLNLTFK